jgi:hypothetical protein
MATVFFSSPQRRYANGDEQVEIEAKRVDELVRALYARYPELDGRLDRMAVSIDGNLHNEARYLPLGPNAEVHFIGAIAGGSGAGPSRIAAAMLVPGQGDPLGFAEAWRRDGLAVALATVVETWGSSPCPAGSQLAVNGDGHFEGSVSGGCVEGAVIEKALEVIESGASGLLEFGIADEEAWAVGLACGGRVKIFVERLD